MSSIAPTHSILRSICSVLAGFLVITVLTTLLPTPGESMLAERSAPAPSSLAYLLVYLGSSLLLSMLGGWLTAVIAPHSLLLHTGALSLLLLFAGFLGALLSAASEESLPLWSLFVRTLLTAAGAAAGGWLAVQRGNRSSTTTSRE